MSLRNLILSATFALLGSTAIAGGISDPSQDDEEINRNRNRTQEVPTIIAHYEHEVSYGKNLWRKVDARIKVARSFFELRKVPPNYSFGDELGDGLIDSLNEWEGTGDNEQTEKEIRNLYSLNFGYATSGVADNILASEVIKKAGGYQRVEIESIAEIVDDELIPLVTKISIEGDETSVFFDVYDHRRNRFSRLIKKEGELVNVVTLNTDIEGWKDVATILYELITRNIDDEEDKVLIGTLYEGRRQEIFLNLNKRTLSGNIHVEGGFLLPCAVDISVRYFYDSEEGVYVPNLSLPLTVDPGDYMPGDAILTPR